MPGAFREVIDLTEDEPALPLSGLGERISKELGVNTQPLPWEVAIPDSQVAKLGESLPRAINFTDYFQRQTGGDCGLTSVNNLVGFSALNESFLNGVQETLRQSQPDRAHHYVCFRLQLKLMLVEWYFGNWLACCSFVCSLH
jgi:hypothetical protein